MECLRYFILYKSLTTPEVVFIYLFFIVNKKMIISLVIILYIFIYNLLDDRE